MLKKSASIVLTSLRGLPVPNSVRLASQLAAALLDGLFEHPARRSSFAPDMQAIEVRCAKTIFHTRLGRRKAEVEVEAKFPATSQL
jgi:hypothetical protein